MVFGEKIPRFPRFRKIVGRGEIYRKNEKMCTFYNIFVKRAKSGKRGKGGKRGHKRTAPTFTTFSVLIVRCVRDVLL